MIYGTLTAQAIEGKRGVFGVLDESSSVAHGTDAGFVAQLLKNTALGEGFGQVRAFTMATLTIKL